MDLGGKPVLSHVVRRARLIRHIDQVVVATSTESSDDLIADWCAGAAIPVFRGPLDDVLHRYLACCREADADVVVRITADCPLLDPEISSQAVDLFLARGLDYVAFKGGFPDGLDTQVFSKNALEIADKRATKQFDREHVGPYVEDNPDIFRIEYLRPFTGAGNFRWTLDFPEDLELLRKIFEFPGFENGNFGARELFDIFETHPELLEINSHRIASSRSNIL